MNNNNNGGGVGGLDENCYDANKRELNLSHRNLRELDTAIIAAYHSEGKCIEYLDVSHNRITRLEWISQLPHLRCLIMDDNRLREAHFEKLKKVSLPTVTTLTLNKNELSDLDTTAEILQQTFPNLEYLSLHGNPMCPDNLYLQPFSEFVPYEYKHYRTVLSNSLPRLKFLDHFSLDAFHSQQQPQSFHQVNHEHHQVKQQQQPQPGNEQLPSTSRDLWSKLKSFLNVHNVSESRSSNANRSNSSQTCAPHCNSTYKGIHSEGNRFITNSDL